MTITEIPFVLDPLTACGYSETVTGTLTDPVDVLPTGMTFTYGVGFVINISDITMSGCYKLMQVNVLDDAAVTTYSNNIFRLDLDPCGQVDGLET